MTVCPFSLRLGTRTRRGDEGIDFVRSSYVVGVVRSPCFVVLATMTAMGRRRRRELFELGFLQLIRGPFSRTSVQ